MDVVTALGLVLLGLALLAGGGEALVRAATTLAELAGVTPAVIGLTVVAMGTSLPVMFAASLLGLLLARDGQLDRLEGGFFLVTIVLFIAFTVHGARTGVGTAEA